MSTSTYVPHISSLLRKPQDVEEEYKYVLLAQQGDSQALSVLVECNLAYVIHLSRQYSLIYKNQSLGELLAEGSLGLLKGILSFQRGRGSKRLISWAAWWIKAAIMRFFSKDVPIPLPSNFIDSKNTIDREMNIREQASGRAWNVNIVMEDLGTPLLDRERYASLSHQFLSLDEMVRVAGERGGPRETSSGFSRHEIIPDPAPSVEEVWIQKEIVEILQRSLDASGDHRLFQIIEALWGLSGAPCLKFKELSAIFEISEERIRQLRNRALTLIRENETLVHFCTTLN